MANFPVDRSLLNPKFEGYRLSSLPEDQHILRYALPSGPRPTQANVSGRTKVPLSFEEVQSRITHNHLCVGWDGRDAAFVDEEMRVVKVRFSEALEPVFDVVFEIPKPIHTPGVVSSDVHKEYPSIASLPNNVWLVSDGLGLLYVYDASTTPGRLLASRHLPRAENDGSLQHDYIPFKINAAHVATDGTVVCVLSSRDNDSVAEVTSSTTTSKHHAPQFHLWIASIPLQHVSESLDPSPLQILWQGSGGNLPIYVGLNESKSAFCVLSASQFREIGRQTPPTYEPTPDEFAPIPRAGENLDGNANPPEINAPKLPPYSWTQTSDSVTVAFPVPSHIPKSSMKVTLTPKTLTLTINATNSTLIDLPRYSTKPFWDGISPSSSFWTWDKEGDKKFGLLTLHLDKQHEGTRWSHVFATSGTKPESASSSDPADIDVPETLDPSELYQIRETLEKYTSALRDGEDASGLGLGSGIPSLADGEMDAVDANVGRQFVVSWIGVDGKFWGGDMEGLPSTLLSTPLPGPAASSSKFTLITKSDIDGLLFTEPAAPSASPIWTHASTFPALAFVLASKGDLRFTYHVSSKIVLAFESGAGMGGGNVYIYRHPVGSAVWAKQSILRVSGAECGALLGVGCVGVDKEQNLVVCLTEKAIVILKSIV